MLSRVAEDLFWIGRYVERADNVARLVDAARRMAALPHETGSAPSNEWSSILIAAGARESFGPGIEQADVRAAVDHLLFAETNPSSVRRCIAAARENARAIRNNLPSDCWESLNSTWAEMRQMPPAMASGSGLAGVLDMVKARAATFRGFVFGTMMRDDTFNFIRLGASVERVDYTARLLDVKYHVLLPRPEDIGAPMDYYQWVSLLQAAAAHRSYVRTMEADITARGVADFLIFREALPHSILYNVRRMQEHVHRLGEIYAREAACLGAVHAFMAALEKETIDSVFDYGLHEFLTHVIECNYNVANRLSEAYGFAAFIDGPSMAKETVTS